MTDPRRARAVFGVLAVLALWPATGAAQEGIEEDALHPCQGLPIGGVRFEGCKGYWCDEPGERAKLLSMVDLRPGMAWDEATITRARVRLEETGFFRAVEEHCQLPDEIAKAWVLVRVHPNRWVRRIRIVGNESLFESEVRKRLFLRPGRAFNPSDEFGQDERRRQEELLERRYQKDGFDEVDVTIRATEIGSDGVDLEIDIMEGARKKVTAVDVKVEGPREDAEEPEAGGRCPRFRDREIRVESGLKPGDVFSRRKEKTARRNLKRFLRSRGIEGAMIDVIWDAGTRRTKIEIAYSRCWLIRFRVRHDHAPARAGFTTPDDTDELLDRLSFGETGVFRLEEAERSRAALETGYQQKGYLFADVRLDFRERELERSDEGVRGVISFYVTLGYQSEIRNITIRGNSSIEREKMLELMDTRTYDFFGAGGYLIVERMLGDLHRIAERYRSMGRYRVRFPRAPPPAERQEQIRVSRRTVGEDFVYDYTFRDLHFALRKHPKESVIYLEVDLEEGPLSQVGEVTLTSPEPGLLDELRGLLESRPGGPYAATKVATDRAAILEYLQVRGHHQAALETTCIAYLEGRQTLPECDWRKVSARKVDLKHVVRPGPRMTVGEIFIRGLDRTALSMIRNKLPETGDRLNRLELDASEADIRAMGIFSNVELRLVGLDQATRRDRVALIATLQERPAQFIELTTGVEQVVVDSKESADESETGRSVLFSTAVTNAVGGVDVGFRGVQGTTPLNLLSPLTFLGTTYRHKNFLGRAVELEVPLRYGFTIPEGTDSDDLEFAFTRLIELTPRLRVPRPFGYDVSTVVELFGRYDTATDLKDKLEAGLRGTVSTTFFDRLSLAGGVSFGGIRTDSDLAEKLRDLGDDPLMQPKFEVNVSATLDYMDSPIHPTEGFALSTQVTYIYSNENDLDELRNSGKVEFSAKGAVSFRRSLVLAALVRYGISFTENGEPLDDSERYKLGGIFGLRGLEDASVRFTDDAGVPDKDFVGGNSLIAGTIEARIPLLRREAFGLWLGTFFDWGALSDSFAFEPASFRITAGVGFRLLLSGIPIRVDVGFNLDPRCQVGEDGRAVLTTGGDCLFGEEPLTATEFGLLYTF